jgi:hypothetical protein
MMEPKARGRRPTDDDTSDEAAGEATAVMALQAASDACAAAITACSALLSDADAGAACREAVSACAFAMAACGRARAGCEGQPIYSYYAGDLATTRVH